MRRRICGALLGGLSQGKMSGWSAGVWVVGTVEVVSVSGDGSIEDAGIVEGVGEGMEAEVKVGELLGVADGPVEEGLLGVDDGSAEGKLVGAGGVGGGVLRGGSDEQRELSDADKGLSEGALPVGGLVSALGAVGGGCGTLVAALLWKGEGALMPICSRQVKSVGVTWPSLLEMLLMMAVTSFLRWPLERVFQGEECVVSAGSDGNMEFCSCSANSSKASGSVEAKVGIVDGKGEGESGTGSEFTLCVAESVAVSSMVGSGSIKVAFVFHCLSGPKSVVHRSHFERWHDDL